MYVLAKRVTQSSWLPYVVAVASVAVPWMTLSSFLLSEVVAYPAFALALLAIQAAIARPSARNDVLAAAAIAAGRARAHAVLRTGGRAGRSDRPARPRRTAPARTLRAHLTLVVLYVLGGVAAIGILASGRHVLGTYAQTASGNPLPAQIVGSAPAHLAIVALAGGLLPFVVGGAWLVSNLGSSESSERHAFAWLALTTIVTLTIEVASFDLRFGGGLVRDRYLFYLTPVILTAFAAALTAARPPRWSLAVPVALLAIGFWRAPLTSFVKLNADTPASVLNDWLLRELHGVTGVRIFLALAAVVVAAAYLEATLLLPRATVALGAAVLLLVGASGRDRLRLQAPVRRRRHVGIADHARPERRLRLGRPHDHRRTRRR